MSGCQECAFFNPYENLRKKKMWQGNHTLCSSAQPIEMLSMEPRAGQHTCVGGKKVSSFWHFCGKSMVSGVWGG